MASDRDEAALAQRTLIAFHRALTHWGTRGSVEEGGGALLCAAGSSIPVVGNAAFRTDDGRPGTDLVTRADAFFGGLGRGYSVKVRDTGQDDDLGAACTAAGLAVFGPSVPEMIRRAPLPAPVVPDGIELRAVDDEHGVRAFTEVNAEAYATYGMPAEVLADLFDRPDKLLGDGAVHVVVAWRGAEPVAAALAYESDGVASVQWVGTVPAARALGLGGAVTTWVTNRVLRRGASFCSLQASPMGEPVYRGLGYETVHHFSEYVRWSAPART